MSETLLKPCPFCGGKARYIFRQFDIFTNAVEVRCFKCGCRTELIKPSCDYTARDVAAERWNKRVVSDD